MENVGREVLTVRTKCSEFRTKKTEGRYFASTVPIKEGKKHRKLQEHILIGKQRGVYLRRILNRKEEKESLKKRKKNLIRKEILKATKLPKIFKSDRVGFRRNLMG